MTTSTTHTYLDQLDDYRALATWCDVRETSLEVGQAIHELSRAHELAPNVIWDEGAPEAWLQSQIIQRAWHLADDSVTELHWGDNTITR